MEKDYRVKSLDLAAQGAASIYLAEMRMPTLVRIRRRFEAERPLDGVQIGACLHVTRETAVLLRTLRAGVCLQESEAGRFLIYGYFSSVTPSAMARVFEAYGCRYAMHLDMNALEHTYLAVYRRQQGGLDVEHLIRGMDVLDKKEGDRVVPRFLGFPDNRDFFYLLRKEPRW